MKKRLYYLLFFLIVHFISYSQVPTIQWQKTYGGSENEEAWCIIQTKDSGYAIAGTSASNDSEVTGNHGEDDYWVVKINSTGTIEWEKSYGGSGEDKAASIIQTTDGGYAVAGGSNSNDGDVTGNHGNYDFWIVKLDSIGNLIWEKSLGGSNDEIANSIIQTTDGGYAIAGMDSSFNGDVTGDHGGDDFWVVKLDSAGDLMWEKSLGGSGYDVGLSIIQIKNGSYTVAGVSASNDGEVTGNHGGYDFWIVNLDSAGNIIWANSYGGSGNEYPGSIIQTTGSAYIVTGYTTSDDGEVTGNHGGYDFWAVNLDSIGNLVWEKCFGGSGFDVACCSITQTKENGFAIEGFSDSKDGQVTDNHGGLDYWIVKIDSAGDLLWEKSLGGSEDDYAESILQTNDEGYIIAGYTSSNDDDVTGNHGGNDYWIVKLGMATGIEEVNAGVEGLRVYPNPANEVISVNYEGGGKANEIVINDITGREILRQNADLQNSTQQLNIKSLASGLYFLQLKNEAGVVGVGRFVKE